MSGALLTDLYELNMAASYLRRSMDGSATFSLFVRDLPPRRSFLVAAGLEPCIDWLEKLSFDRPSLEFLAGLGFDAGTIEALSNVRFTGEVWAVPEGRIVFAGEPLVEVTAPIAEAQLAETFLLNQVNFQTTIASKAARCRIASRDRVQLVEFGFRRTQGTEAGIAAARLTALVGFAATSNVEAARRYGLALAGTMAHSYVEAFPTEKEAFVAFAKFAKAVSTSTVFLVDTYDTLSGVEHAIEVIKELGLESHSGVRLDSGDLDQLARQTRQMLDAAGLSEVRIFLSGGLDELDIDRFVDAGTPFAAAGVGTLLGVSADAPYLDSVYKLVEYGGRPVLKLSTGKATLPGPKQVFRRSGMRDLLGLRSETAPDGSEPLLEQVMAKGHRVRPAVTLEESRRRFESDLAQLPARLRKVNTDSSNELELTPALRDLTERTVKTARGVTAS
jgi:nicotinate phosphoribosyltransferase